MKDEINKEGIEERKGFKEIMSDLGISAVMVGDKIHMKDDYLLRAFGEIDTVEDLWSLIGEFLVDRLREEFRGQIRPEVDGPLSAAGTDMMRECKDNFEENEFEIFIRDLKKK